VSECEGADDDGDCDTVEEDEDNDGRSKATTALLSHKIRMPLRFSIFKIDKSIFDAHRSLVSASNYRFTERAIHR
jgi:hypothetical protein